MFHAGPYCRAGHAASYSATPALGYKTLGHKARRLGPTIQYASLCLIPPAGSTDVLFCILAERMQDKLARPFVVENRPGASGNVGIDAVAKSAPDGHTTGAATVGHFSINQFFWRTCRITRSGISSHLR